MPSPTDAINQILMQRIIAARRPPIAMASGPAPVPPPGPMIPAAPNPQGLLGGLPPGMPASLMPVPTAMPQPPTNNPGYSSNQPTPIRRPSGPF